MVTAERRVVAPGAGTLVASVLGTVLVSYIALATAKGQSLDERGLRAVQVDRAGLVTLLSVLGRVSIGTVVAVCLVCAAVALVRGSGRLAVAAVVVVGGANVTTQALKHVLLERSDFGIVAANSLPSGHTTAVASGVGALCLVAPRAIRGVLALFGAFAVTLVGSSTVVAGWHRPSDVVAALGVSLAWTALASLVVGGTRRPLRGLVVAAGVGAVVATAALVVLGVRPAADTSTPVQVCLVYGVLGVAAALTVALMERVSPTQVDPAQP